MILEGVGPDDMDLILYGVYQCPECKEVVTIPEYRVMNWPCCPKCQEQGKTIRFELLWTYWDI
ncbi:hypothetical protein JQC72_14925 [Polycladomyces sp. WAk]|uniref:Uncharacterized protein n=1 Tax=Polycladomyces zharkentensis TaxID=2807616 RepID=A0ABS2WMX1_9BACL|nr:hypothetical protein [Polycladomyces sp. WAk]